MTKRAALIGILGGILIGVGGRYAANFIPGMHGVVTGHMPVTVFGALIVFAILINPLLRRIHERLAFSAKEIAVILALLLIACSLPTAGLMRYFPRTLVHPLVHYRSEPGWQRAKLLEYTPTEVLANDARYSDEVVADYVAPQGEKGKPIPITAVPWYAWWRSLAFWSIVILCFKFAQLSLATVVHRQWAAKERLRYPLADLASSLIQRDEKGRVVILGVPAFWYGLALVLVIRLLAGLHKWFPQMIHIPLKFDFSAFKLQFPEFARAPNASWLFTPTLYPVCIGVTFLLASDIAFSLGISGMLSTFIMYGLIVMGVKVGGTQMTGGLTRWQVFGSFVAMGIMVLYSGRRYYWHTLREALTFKSQPETETAGVWACRVFLLCVTTVTVTLSSVGLDWPVALAAVLMILLVYLICARLIAECGTFFFAPGWMMPGVVVGLFGLTNLGPRIIIILGMLFYILTFDPFESLMPFAVNGMKTASSTGLKIGRIGLLGGLVIVLVLLLGTPAALWSDYNLTPDMRHGGDSREIYNAAEQDTTQLALAGQIDKINANTWWDRVREMRPDRGFLLAAGIGFVLVIACSILRLRFTRWPLHPVVFLGFASWTMAKFGYSFLIGWALKAMFVRFGGANLYRKTRPFMIGVVVGDLAGGFLLMFIGWVYLWITGTYRPSALIW